MNKTIKRNMNKRVDQIRSNVKKVVFPESLKVGDRVAVISPSSPAGDTGIINAERSLRFLGLIPVFFKSCYAENRYLSGSDELRAQDINDSFSDKGIKGIVCIRGGYGAMRILSMIDYDIISNNPKVFWGYSDITCLHNAINEITGLVTFHGSMPFRAYDELDSYTIHYLKKFLFGLSNSDDVVISNPESNETRVLVGGRAEGYLTGGNLSVLVSTLSSPYEVDTTGKILLIEDTDEEVYKIDRMLTSLSLSGKLKDCSGFIVGSFTNIREGEAESVSVDHLIEEIIVPLGKPTISGFASGHSYPHAMVPMGAFIRIDADSGKIKVISD